MRSVYACLLAPLFLLAACSSAPSGAETAAGTAADAPAPSATPGAEAAPSSAQAPRKQFPDMQYLEQIPYAYQVAGDHPEMLAQIPCYCPCELYGHTGVVDCYRSQHAAACATCLEEAVVAGRMLEQGGKADSEAYARVAAQVKARYRDAIRQSYVERNEMPGLQTAGGAAYLRACSNCHQPPHPAMYTPDAWRQSLARMETYARQRGMEEEPQVWQSAVDYVRATAGQFPPEAGDKYRQSLAEAVDHLKAAEGESAHYPSVQDPVLSPQWFERMVSAYRLARDIPAEALAAVSLEDPSCSNLLQCLNGGFAVTSEAAVEAVERLAAERGLGND